MSKAVTPEVRLSLILKKNNNSIDEQRGVVFNVWGEFCLFLLMYVSNVA